MNSLDISKYLFNDNLSINQLSKIKFFNKYAFQILLSVRRLLFFIGGIIPLEKIFSYYYPIIDSGYFFTVGISYTKQHLKYEFVENNYDYIRNGFLMLKYVIDNYIHGLYDIEKILKLFNLKYFSKLEIIQLNKKINKYYETIQKIH